MGLLLLPLLSAFGVERFPPPELDPSTYKMPATTTPPARAHIMDYVDVALLFGTLALASYLVLVKRLRKWIFWLMLFSLGYFGFVRKGCICPIGSIQDVTLALFNPGYAVPISVVIFFLLPLVFTVFFGRGFCAGVCPLGAAQDLMLWKSVTVKPWLEQALGLIPYIYLGLAVLFAATSSAFVICEWDPFVAFFRRSGSITMLLLGAGFLVLAMFVGRPYCRFLCPYGAILSVLSRISKWNVVLTPDDCIQCQICEVACPYGAIAQPSESEQKAAAAKAGCEVPPSGGAKDGPAVLGKRALVLAICILPILVFAGGWLGGKLSVPLSKMNRTVQLAERIAAEDAGKITAVAAGVTLDKTEKNNQNASKAFRQTGSPSSELFAQALSKRGEFLTGGWLLGAFIGLVIGGKLVALASPQKRSIYEPDRATCLACGRCYSYCPKELVRIKRVKKSK
jgi:NosR/NirI family transcriptional regulator, nitrous oxide reductase regulator